MIADRGVTMRRSLAPQKIQAKLSPATGRSFSMNWGISVQGLAAMFTRLREQQEPLGSAHFTYTCTKHGCTHSGICPSPTCSTGWI